jgi:hypothetical protein
LKHFAVFEQELKIEMEFSGFAGCAGLRLVVYIKTGAELPKLYHVIDDIGQKQTLFCTNVDLYSKSSDLKIFRSNKSNMAPQPPHNQQQKQGNNVCQQPSSRKPSPYSPLPADDENKSILIGIALFHLITFFIVPAMRAYLISKNKAVYTHDFKELLEIFKGHIKSDPLFLISPLSNTDLEHLRFVRNDINHDDLPRILSDWKRHFSVLRRLCVCINDTNANINATRIFNDINNGNFVRVVRFQFYFSNGYNSYVSRCLTQIIYAILVKYVAKHLWRFMKIKRVYGHLPPIDIYRNLKTAIKKQLANANFIWHMGLAEKDSETLSNCLFARNCNRHGKLIETDSNWVSFLESIIKFLERLGENVDANHVRTILHKLKRARRNGTQVSYQDLMNV